MEGKKVGGRGVLASSGGLASSGRSGWLALGRWWTSGLVGASDLLVCPAGGGGRLGRSTKRALWAFAWEGLLEVQDYYVGWFVQNFILVSASRRVWTCGARLNKFRGIDFGFESSWT